MKQGKVIAYSSIDESIKDWVRRYNKYWYGLDTSHERLNIARYCTSGCEHRAKNYNHGKDLLAYNDLKEGNTK